MRENMVEYLLSVCGGVKRGMCKVRDDRITPLAD